MRAPGTKRGRRATPPSLRARLGGHATLEAQANGDIVVNVDGYPLGLGRLSPPAAARARDLRTGLPLAASGDRNVGKEIDQLVRRLARHGLLEFCLRRPRTDADQVVVEPQVADYWPQTPPLADADVLVLSRFAYLRRRGNEMVLESPRAGALFRIGDAKVAAVLAMLATPQPIKRLRRQDGFPGTELLALLVDCHILFKVAAGGTGLRPNEGDTNLVLWDFHDLLFHARSAEGRHANPLGGVYPHLGAIPPLPAVRLPWPGKKVDLRAFAAAPEAAISPRAKLLHERHSTRSFDEKAPITLAELARFLSAAARVRARWSSDLDMGEDGPTMEYAARPYPSAGASYELELYLAVDACAGLDRGFYHYDAGGDVLAAIPVGTPELEALLTAAQFAMDAPGAPQILIIIAARFGRISWKYSSLAYALILKDVGVLMQTLYLMATDMGLGGCAIGTNNIDRFAKITGIKFHVEGPVGQFALGRAMKSEASSS